MIARALIWMTLLVAAPSVAAPVVAARSSASGTLNKIAAIRSRILADPNRKHATGNGWHVDRAKSGAVGESWGQSRHMSSGYFWGSDGRTDHSARVLLDPGGNVHAATSITTKLDKGGYRHVATIERVVDGERSIVRAPVRVVALKPGHKDGEVIMGKTITVVSDATPEKQHQVIAGALHAGARSYGARPSNDVALGRESTRGRQTLDHFASAVGASMYRTWGMRDLAHKGSARIDEFEVRFRDALDTAIARGGRVKLDLTGIDMEHVLAHDEPLRIGGITAWELRQVLKEPRYRRAVDFYKEDTSGAFHKLSADEERKLSIARPY